MAKVVTTQGKLYDQLNAAKALLRPVSSGGYKLEVKFANAIVTLKKTLEREVDRIEELRIHTILDPFIKRHPTEKDEKGEPKKLYVNPGEPDIEPEDRIAYFNEVEKLNKVEIELDVPLLSKSDFDKLEKIEAFILDELDPYIAKPATSKKVPVATPAAPTLPTPDPSRKPSLST